LRFKACHVVLAVAIVFLAVLAVGYGPRLLRHLPLPRYLPPVPLGPKCAVPLQISAPLAPRTFYEFRERM